MSGCSDTGSTPASKKDTVPPSRETRYLQSKGKRRIKNVLQGCLGMDDGRQGAHLAKFQSGSFCVMDRSAV